MALLGLGYAGFGSDALRTGSSGPGWSGYSQSAGQFALAFRWTTASTRVIDRAIEDSRFRLEVTDAAALDQLAGRLEAGDVNAGHR
jgi:hypothetical protein